MARGIIFLKKTEWSLYDPALPTIITTPYPSTAVINMDVVNDDELEEAIKKVFTANKLVIPNTYGFILSKDILFTKEYIRFDLKSDPVKPSTPHTPTSEEQKQTEMTSSGPPLVSSMTTAEKEAAKAEQEAQIQSYIEHVPFEEVGSKVLTMPKSLLVVAANQDLYKTIKDALKTEGHTVDCVLPSVLFEEAHLDNGFTIEAAKLILTKVDDYRKYNFLHDEVVSTPRLITNTPANPKKEKQKTMILIGVFVFLFLFMIILYYVMYMLPKPKKVANTPSVLPTFTPAVTLQPTEPASSSAGILSSLDLKIIAKSTTSSEASSLRSSLSSLGITDITITSQTGTTPPKTFVVFTSDIPAIERTKIIELIQKAYPSVSSQENATDKGSVTIILGAQ